MPWQMESSLLRCAIGPVKLARVDLSRFHVGGFRSREHVGLARAVYNTMSGVDAPVVRTILEGGRAIADV